MMKDFCFINECCSTLKPLFFSPKIWRLGHHNTVPHRTQNMSISFHNEKDEMPENIIWFPFSLIVIKKSISVFKNMLLIEII